MSERRILRLKSALRLLIAFSRNVDNQRSLAELLLAFEAVADIDRRMRPTVWMQGGCKSWYLDAHGRNSTLWPGFVPSYQRLLRRFEPTAYVGR